MPFIHKAYGLRIRSDLELPELKSLQPDEGRSLAEVSVRLGILPNLDPLACPRFDLHTWANETSLRLSIPEVGSFLVRNGNEILIEPAPGIDEDSLRVFLVGSAFGALLMQRGLLVLHGNAIRVANHAMICCGDSGVGKSTLAAGFMLRDYAVLADDVVPVSSDAYAIPGVRRIKLWRDAAERLGISTASLHRVSPDIDKLHLPLKGQEDVTPLKIRWIYFLNSGPVNQVKIDPIDGLERFQPLHDNTYRLPFVDGLKLRGKHLAQCAQLASQVHLARVTRPEASFDLDALIEGLLKDMGDCQ